MLGGSVVRWTVQRLLLRRGSLRPRLFSSPQIRPLPSDDSFSDSGQLIEPEYTVPTIFSYIPPMPYRTSVSCYSKHGDKIVCSI